MTWMSGSVTGHAQVLVTTSRSKVSGRCCTTASPIGPPQSWPTKVTLLNPSESTNLPMIFACSVGRYRYPSAAVESPNPG